MDEIVPLENFKIIDALKDGACLYKCLLNYILLNINDLYLNDRSNTDEILENLLNHINNVLKDNLCARSWFWKSFSETPNKWAISRMVGGVLLKLSMI